MGVPLIQTPAARLFVNLTDGAPQVMGAIKDLDGRYVYANPGFCGRLGLPLEQVVGRTVSDLFEGDLADSYEEQDEKIRAGGPPQRGFLELIVRADGSLGWYVTSKAPVPDGDESCVGIAVLSIDLHSQMASSHAGLATALAAVRSDVARPWRLAELAEIAGLSTKQLQRLCRGTLGLPPQQVIQRMRLEEAVRLATSTDATFGQIAADCGFYDQASFTRQFRKVLGVTPRAYRSRAHARQRRGR